MSVFPSPSDMADARQACFADALRNPDAPIPEGVAAWNDPAPARRFAVYRNNVASSLRGALAARFPATQAIVGEDFFAGLAAAFTAAHPPRSPLLLDYGDMLAGFVEQFEPAAELSYLPDVIRLEALRSTAHHAEDRAPLDPAELAQIDPDRIGLLRFLPHPSFGLLRSAHPVVTIWAMNSGEQALAPIEPWRGEDALVIRPQMIVELRRLPPGGAAFLAALAAGETLGDAAEAGAADSPEFDLTINLAGALQSGVFTAIS